MYSNGKILITSNVAKQIINFIKKVISYMQ